MAFNIVELIASPEESAFDQPCKFGHRCETHAVYCHNDAWEDGPRKCRRSWYTGGSRKDEDCPGFEPNPSFKGALNPTPLAGAPCSKCAGVRLKRVDHGKTETCPHCEGDGCEPQAIEMTQYEQDTLEMAHSMAREFGERFVRIAENRTQVESIDRLIGLNLIVLRSVTWTGSAQVHLLESTGKGAAVMKANWNAKKKETL